MVLNAVLACICILQFGFIIYLMIKGSNTLVKLIKTQDEELLLFETAYLQAAEVVLQSSFTDALRAKLIFEDIEVMAQRFLEDARNSSQ